MAKRTHPKQRQCLRCGCTDREACPGGCGWVSQFVDLCSSCVTVREAQILRITDKQQTVWRNANVHLSKSLRSIVENVILVPYQGTTVNVVQRKYLDAGWEALKQSAA